MQAIDGIRTVASFNLINHVMAIYERDLQIPLREGIKRGFIDGVLLGFSQLVVLSTYGFVFW